MTATTFRNLLAAVIENDDLRVTVLEEGGHIAEVFDKETGVNPLWTPPWQPIEPSSYTPDKYPEFGRDSDARLLAGIMGHNSCLDIFGEPSIEEAAAGLTTHGEVAVAAYEIRETNGVLISKAHLPLAQLHFERSIELRHRSVNIRESVENLTACDRPIGWTQHVSLGPPFLTKGATQIRASVTRSKVYEAAFGIDMHLERGAEFDWPNAPRSGGGVTDLRVMTNESASSEYTTHMGNPQCDDTFFVAYTPAFHLAFGYVWKRADFPWLGIWQENCSRKETPWRGQTVVLGMEFGVSPMPEPRREMMDRGRLFGIPTCRWLAAHGRLEVEYWMVMQRTDHVPEFLNRPE